MKRYFNGISIPDTEGIGNVWYVGHNGESEKLLQRNDLINYPDQPYQWGSHTSACRPLALAILARSGDDQFAVDHHVEFMREVISLLHNWTFSLDFEYVRGWIKRVHVREGYRPSKYTLEEQ